jgi:hypothetical protein
LVHAGIGQLDGKMIPITVEKKTTCPINRSNFRCMDFCSQLLMRGTQMGTMVDTIQNAIIPEPEAEAQPGTTQVDDTAIETQLRQEISDL